MILTDTVKNLVGQLTKGFDMEETEEPETVEVVPPTGDGSNTVLYLGITLLAVALLVVIMKTKSASDEMK